jgi:ketosteroid isomerase-like protein
LTAAQAASIRKTTNSRLDKYRMLLDAEGVTSEASERAPQPTAPEASQPVDDPPSHRGDTSWFRPQFLSSVAYAQAPPAPEGAARQVLEEYRQAQEAGDLQRLASLYVAFPEGQRKKITKYLHNVAQLHVEFADVQIQPRGDELAVSYTRRDRFVDKETGEPVSLEVRVTKFLVNDSGTWKFAEGE